MTSHELPTPTSHGILRDAALIVALAALVIGARLGDALWGGLASDEPQQVVVAAPTQDAAPQLVMIVTATPATTETVVPTRTAISTSTPVPECGEQAIRGLACVEPHPTKTPAVWTPISIWPGHDLATPGVRYLFVPTVTSEP